MTPGPFLFLHGYTGSGPRHWQRWLAARLVAGGHEVLFPELPDPDAPRLEPWRSVLDDTLAALAPREPVVLAHSCGALLWLQHAARATPPATRAARVLLVSPPAPAWSDPNVHGFTPLPLERLDHGRVARSTRLVYGADDPLCPAAARAEYATRLGVACDLIAAGDHLHTAAGYGPWPAVEAWALASRVPLTGR